MLLEIKTILKKFDIFLNLNSYYKKLTKKALSTTHVQISLKERLKQLEKFKNKNIYYLDKKLSDLTIQKKNNFIFFDVAKPPEKNNFSKEAYILIDCNDLATYSFLMSYLEEVFHKNIFIMFYGKMEFSGGTLMSPSNIKSMEWLLFNHFLDYFRISTPLLTFYYEKINDKIINYNKILLGPRKILSNKINSLNSNDQIIVSYFCLNPILTSGSHHRWRAQYEIIDNNNSPTTNHATHSFEFPKNRNFTFFFNPQIDKESELNIVVSESKNSEILNDKFLELDSENFYKKFHFSNVYSNISSKERISKHSYFNSSGYYFIRSKNCLSGNHVISRNDADNKIEKYENKIIEKIKSTKKNNIIYNPFVSPIVKDDICFGINWPITKGKFKLNIYQTLKKTNTAVEITENNSFIKFIDIIENPSQDELVITHVDWEQDNLNSAFNQPDLIAFNKLSNDWDITEFQPSWRNQKFHIEELPHWLGKFKGLNPSCNICGGANLSFFEKNLILLTAQDPKIIEKKIITVQIFFYNKDGQVLEIENHIFENDKAFFIDIKNSIKRHKDEKNIWYNIKCTNTDLICYIIQVTKDKKISIQHLWGY
jgi:hypothetical protein